MKTLEQLLKEGVRILAASGNPEARLDAWLLLEYTTKTDRAYFYAHPEQEITSEQEEMYAELCRKRAEHIPLQHLTHQAFFMCYEFFVNEYVLIPRQDTEILVEEAEKLIKKNRGSHPQILDMCTGSGCILLSLLADCREAEGIGVDISAEALRVARKNAESLKVAQRVQFLESDLFSHEFFWKKDGIVPVRYDILISNPPYIPTAEIAELMEEVQFHDPRQALDGQEDGLYFYREITKQAADYLKPGGWLLYEIGCSQAEDVSHMLKAAGFMEVAVRKDLSGLDRVVMGRRPE